MKSKKRTAFPARDFGEYLLLRGFAGLINFLPVEVSTALASATGDFLFWILPKRRRTALQNLEKAFPGPAMEKHRRKIAREAFRSLAISLMEFFRIPSMLGEAQSRFEFEGTEILDQAFARGKGIIFAISHLGSWEYLAFLPYLCGYPCSVIVRETRNPHIFKWIQELRDQTALHAIPREKSSREILRKLKQNHLVAILIDQWAGPNGLWGNFFGAPTSTTFVPVRLAAHTGAAIVPGYCLRLAPGRYRIVIRPEMPVNFSEEDYESKATERLNRLLEEEIRRAPGQWVWTHRRWKPVARYRTRSARKREDVEA